MDEIKNPTRQLRSKLGMTQEQFAFEVGVSLSTFQRWETGKHPSPLALKAIEKVLTKKRKPRIESQIPRHGIQNYSPNQITAIRVKLSWTRQRFAHEVGVSEVTISRWERGKVLPSGLSSRKLNSFYTRQGIRIKSD
jgi:putative transcriptional regulator